MMQANPGITTPEPSMSADRDTYAVCGECGQRARSGLNRNGGRYLLRPCGHVARIRIIRHDQA